MQTAPIRLPDAFLRAERPLVLPDADLPAGLRIAMLAPHPDDFDAIGVTMRHLHRLGSRIHVAVLTSGANGVEDGWSGADSADAKAALREEEQRAACRFFGLPGQQLAFLRLWEAEQAATRDEARLLDFLKAVNPDLVFLPHGNDSNRTHRRTWETFAALAECTGLQTIACMNMDAKTLDMRADLVMPFDEDAAQWKAELLRHHRSQQARNLKTRGSGFDQRVLDMNRKAAAQTGAGLPYAEVFELRAFNGAG